MIQAERKIDARIASTTAIKFFLYENSYFLSNHTPKTIEISVKTGSHQGKISKINLILPIPGPLFLIKKNIKLTKNIVIVIDPTRPILVRM